MLIQVPLTHIIDNQFQRRRDYGNVESLAADIAARGLLQIPLGRIVYSDGQTITGLVPAKLHAIAAERLNGPDPQPELRVELAFGHRRLRAYRLLHSDHPDDSDAGGLSPWATMPVYLDPLSDDAMLNAVWSENQHRSDINPIEQAELLAEKLDRVRAALGGRAAVAVAFALVLAAPVAVALLAALRGGAAR